MKISKCCALWLKEDCHVRYHKSYTDRQTAWVRTLPNAMVPSQEVLQGTEPCWHPKQKMSQNGSIKNHCSHSICIHCLFLHLYDMEIHRYIVFQTCTNNCIELWMHDPENLSYWETLKWFIHTPHNFTKQLSFRSVLIMSLITAIKVFMQKTIKLPVNEILTICALKQFTNIQQFRHMAQKICI